MQGSFKGSSKKIIFATIGSLGDVHPYIALSQELKRRGHAPTIATSDYHRQTIEQAGITFAPMSPNTAQMGDLSAVVKKLFHPIKGPEYLTREIVMPYVRAAYDELDCISGDADLLVSHPLSFAVRLVAEKRGLPWRSTILAPLSLMSAIDPPLFPPAAFLLGIRKLGVAPYRAVFGLAKRYAGRWEAPLHQLRADLGLPPMGCYAQFEGQYAPAGNLALFSRVLATPQADWPRNTTLCGFSRFDGGVMAPEVQRELDAWLAAGPPPIVFTLGSSVSMAATTFFTQAVQCAAALKHRALLITGQEPAQLNEAIAASGIQAGMIKVFRYLPYSAMFSRAAVNVHQGGVGTLAQALAAGKPQLITPVAFDQPDNAKRTVALGVARTIPFQKLKVRAMTAALQDLLEGGNYVLCAATVAKIIAEEDHAAHAVDVLLAAAGE